MSNVQLIGLVSGEQIIAKVELIENVYSIKNPAIIVPIGKGELALAPWLPYTTVDQTGAVVNKDRVMFVLTPQPELANNYNQNFGSGLIIPDKTVSAPKLSLVE